jgi:hypothetical protein
LVQGRADPLKSPDAVRRVIETLATQHPNADTELHYTTAFELLVATILSAQSTDARVNIVTPALFKKYPDAPTLARAKQATLEKQIVSTGFFRQKAKALRGTMRSGCFVLGDKGWLLAPGDYAGSGIYMPEPELPKVEFEESPGHFTEWVNAIRGQGPSMSNFSNYAGPLAETVLLGNLAVWAAAGDASAGEEQKVKGVKGKKIEWDARNLVATNAPEVAHIVKQEYHNGYKLEG